jgi:hypothetical protein
MDYRVKPKSTWHLLFSEVSSRYVDHGFPVQFNQPIGQSPFGWCSNNLGLVVNEIFTDGGPKEFEATITVKTLSKGACRTTKEPDCRKKRVRGKVIQFKRPVIPGSMVDQGKCIAEAANQEAVPKAISMCTASRYLYFVQSIGPLLLAFHIVT